MSTTLTEAKLLPDRLLPGTPEFRIAIVYETPALGAAAVKLCEKLMENLKDTFLFRMAIESFQSLDVEPRFRLALQAAAGADMIFVGSAGHLPASMLRWLRECINTRRADAPVALVDLTDDASLGATRVHQELRAIADKNHLDLISRAELGEPSSRIILPEFRFRERSHRHWGINE